MTTVMRPVRRTSAFTQTDRSWETWDELGTVESDNMTPTGGISAFTDLGIFRSAELRAGWDKLIDELRRILTLGDDWDGEGSEVPRRDLVSGAIQLAQNLKAKKVTPADRVIASVNGTVYFEWHTPLGYQEIEVVSPLDAELRYVPMGQDVAQVIYLRL